MTPVLFMLCSGFFHFTLASDRLRFFHYSLSETESDEGWDAAMNKCTKMNESLVTLYDKDDARFISQFSKATIRSIWLSLHRRRNDVPTWSNGAHLTFNMSNVNVSNGEQICEAIEKNTSKGFNCSDRKPFMCHKGSGYTLIEKTKNWCQALQYCRKHFTDLVFISNETEKQQVITKGNNKTFWIGLMRDEWEWRDNTCSTYREWEESKEGDCTIQTTKSESPELLSKYGCSSVASVVCSKGSVRIKVIQKNLTWEQAFDYCKANHSGLLQIEDAEEQRAVEQWLNYTQAEFTGTFWIGLRQSRVFGFWIWSDKMVSYSNWRDNKIPEMPLSNYCGVIDKTDKTDNYYWRDENCWLQLPFICEEEIIYMKN